METEEDQVMTVTVRSEDQLETISHHHTVSFTFLKSLACDSVSQYVTQIISISGLLLVQSYLILSCWLELIT